MTTDEITNLKNAAESWRCDSLQLQRMVTAINKAMPHFRSVMGAECDHAELALNKLIEDRDALKAALNEMMREFEPPEAGNESDAILLARAAIKQAEGER